MIKLYGLTTCDTCRKARQEIEKAGKNVEFRDVRKTPLTRDELALFAAQFGEMLINRRSTTWRGLSETDRNGTPESMIAAYPSLMKRPVIENGETLTIGWDAAAKSRHLG